MKRLSLLILTSILLTGCLSGSPTQRYYLLNATEKDSLLSPEQTPPAIEIVAIHLPQYLDRPQIVSRTASSRLRLSESHQWGGNLRKNLIRSMMSNLSQLLNTAQIRSSARRNSNKPDFRLEVEIMEFEKAIDDKIHLTAKWQLREVATNKAINTEITRLISDNSLAKDDYDALVQAMSELYGDLSLRIARQIHQQISATP